MSENSEKNDEKQIFRGKTYSAWKTGIRILLNAKKLAGTLDKLPADADDAAKMAFEQKQALAVKMIVDRLDNQQLIEVSEVVNEHWSRSWINCCPFTKAVVQPQ